MRQALRAAAPALLALASAGCAGLRPPDMSTKDVAPQQAKRREDVVRQFEASRDQAQYQAAANFLSQGNYKACRQSLDQLLGRNPAHVDARLLLADLLVEQEDYDGAEKQLQQVLARHPQEARAEHALGVALDAKGAADEARRHYARAAELDPGNETYRLSCQIAAGADSGGPAPAAAAQSKPGGVQAAGWQMASDDRPAAAESSQDSELLLRFEAALEEADAAAQRRVVAELERSNADSPQIRLKAAVIALRHERPELAAEIAAAAAARFPKSAEAHRIVGTAEYRRGRYASAQTALAAALSLDKSAALSYFLMGCTLNKLGQAQAAAINFARAGELDPRFAASGSRP